jgi:hypothetical protein
MRCSYRGVGCSRQTISLEVREKEIISIYRGVNLYSRQIQTSIQPMQSIPRFTMKYRGNVDGLESLHNSVKAL